MIKLNKEKHMLKLLVMSDPNIIIGKESANKYLSLNNIKYFI